MTDIQRRPAVASLALIAKRVGVKVERLPNNWAALTGTLAEVGQALAAIEQAGQLVSSTRPAPHGDGLVLVNVRLAPAVQRHRQPAAAPRRRLPRWAFWSIIVGATLLLAGLGWLVYAVVAAILANLAAFLLAVGAVVIVIAVLGAALGSGGKTFSGTFKGRID